MTRALALRTVARMARCAVVAAAASVLGGCYAQTPLASLPAPGTRIIAELNDAGRVGMAAQMGPSIRSVEGLLDSTRTDSTFTLHVLFVSFLDGTVARWSGEPVTVWPTFVQQLSERHLAKGRTALLAGGVAAALGVFAFTRGLGILGGGADNTTPGGQNGNSNSQWVHP